ncbi:MAG: glutamine amidotransferase [Demequina sp.]
MECIAVRHVAFEGLGVWEAEISAHGYDVTYADVGIDDLAGVARADLAVIMGGPIGVNDAERFPVLTEEIALLRSRLDAGLPTIGVCLGAAAAAGAQVMKETTEIGWQPVSLTDAGAAGPLRHLEGVPVMHWHGDTFDLPPGSQLLASTPGTLNQAFTLDRSWGVQFHPEVDGREVEQWLIGHVDELDAHGIDVPTLRAQCHAHADHAAMAGVAMVREMLRP